MPVQSDARRLFLVLAWTFGNHNRPAFGPVGFALGCKCTFT
jgi:hypothetical protein